LDGVWWAFPITDFMTFVLVLGIADTRSAGNAETEFGPKKESENSETQVMKRKLWQGPRKPSPKTLKIIGAGRQG
jgi:hypothetical protein